MVVGRRHRDLCGGTVIYNLSVPPNFREALTVLARLEASAALRLTEFFASTTGLSTPEQLTEGLIAAVPATAPFASELVDALTSLIARWVEGDQVKPVDVAKAVSKYSGLRLEDAERSTLADRLERLLVIDCLRLTSKAIDVITDYEHVFAGARILTDIRPVFRGPVTELPAGAVTVDTLKIDYFGPDNELTSFHVALDRSDLLQLQAAVKRALDKRASVARFLESARLATWEEPGDA
jgi:hypothetical protein